MINENRQDHVKAWQEFQFLPGVLDALKRLSTLKTPIVVVTNQAIVGRGLVERVVIDEIHRRMLSQILAAGGWIDAIFYCPHQPTDQCGCRKPQPGMLQAAAELLHLDLGRSVLIGDAETDILAAQRVGCRPFLVQTGRGSQEAAKLELHKVSGYSIHADLVAVAAHLVNER